MCGCESDARTGYDTSLIYLPCHLVDHLETVLLQQLQKIPISPNMEMYHNEIHGLLLQARALLSNHYK